MEGKDGGCEVGRMKMTLGTQGKHGRERERFNQLFPFEISVNSSYGLVVTLNVCFAGNTMP